MHSLILGQSNRYKSWFNIGDCMRVQDTEAKGKMCRYLGKILEQTSRKDSYFVQLDSGGKIWRHKRLLRLEPTMECAD